MTVETVKSVTRRFLTSKAAAVLAIKGSWGTGKTFTWNKLVADAKSGMHPNDYAYVSLFGITSLPELRLAIFANTRPARLLGEKIDAATLKKEWLSLGWSRVKSIGAFLSQRDGPYLKQLSIGLDAVAPYLISDTVVCLDDFERLSDKVPSDQLLGFISTLKEQKGCKVVLIFNEDELGANRAAYNKYREKVIDIELLFAPTAEEAAELAFGPETPYRNDAKQHAISLALRNIRVLRRVVDVLRLIEPEISGLHEAVAKQAVSTTVIGVASYYAPSATQPPLSFIRTWNGFAWGFKTVTGKDIDPQEAQWNTILEAYGIKYIDEFDLALLNVIERGYLEESGLKRAAAALDAQCRAGELESQFTAAWSLFHDTLTNNPDELIRQLTGALKASVHQVSPVNLNGTAQLLRELRRDDLANEVIDYYVEARKTERKLFDLDESPFRGEIKDEYLKKRFLERVAITEELPTLREAAVRVAEQSGWSAAALIVLKSATVDDYYDLFKADHGRALHGIIKACLHFKAHPEHADIAYKAREALERIGAESTLNALRVKRYGVGVTQAPEPAPGE
jgi:hypothetical protein